MMTIMMTTMKDVDDEDDADNDDDGLSPFCEVSWHSAVSLWRNGLPLHRHLHHRPSVQQSEAKVMTYYEHLHTEYIITYSSINVGT